MFAPECRAGATRRERDGRTHRRASISLADSRPRLVHATCSTSSLPIRSPRRRVVGQLNRAINPPSGLHQTGAYFCAMNQIICSCGAIYEAVGAKGRTPDPNLFKCLVCGKEIISAKAYKVGDLHLISRPPRIQSDRRAQSQPPILRSAARSWMMNRRCV
jgi:hypothetical protein